MEPTAAPAGSTHGASAEELQEILEALIDGCTHLGPSTAALEAAVQTVVDALDARSAQLFDSDGVVIAEAVAVEPTEGEPSALDAATPIGGRLHVEFAGPSTVDARQFALVAHLIGLVADVVEARRDADARFDTQREAWGQEIHDGVSQSVLTTVAALNKVRRAIAGTPGAELLETAEHHIHESLAELRSVLTYAVDESGRLVPVAVGETLSEVIDDVRTRWRLQARISVLGDLADVSPAIASVARSVVREGLVNVAKHAGASRVTITIARETAGLRVAVDDDGVGPTGATTAGEPGMHLGLQLLAQRVSVVGGTIRVGPSRAGGTQVEAVLPLTT